VTDTPAPPPAAPVPPAEPVAAVPPPLSQGVAASAPLPVASGPGRWIAAGAAVLAALATAALVFAWNTQQRVKALETELVKRQQDSASLSTEARTLARNADVTAREAAAKMALLEARVAETTMQRSQLEDLIQSLARSRDENVLADVEAAIRVALQQAAITGSAEPLVLTLKQADERLARYNQPRLERVRRAVAQDLERTRTAGVADVTVLTIRLDDVIRQVDDLPLLALPERRAGQTATARPAPRSEEPSAAPAQPASDAGWSDRLGQAGSDFLDHLWQEVKALIRVTRIDQPEAMLVAPEQAFFLRENLKLRLLNARLALLSRQFDTAQSDLRDAQSALDRYFDRNSRRVGAASETVRQVMGQSRLVNTPRPDATLAAIAAAAAGR
jgi:uroporphyrin-3 C-methyltransferase